MDKQTAIEKILNYISNNQLRNYSHKTLEFDKIHNLVIENYNCKVKELSWREALDIDSKSFKMNNNAMYFSSEYEKREIIKLALLSISDEKNNEIQFNLEDLSHSFVENFWNEYQKYLHLSSDEIDFIYNSAKKYFDSTNSEIYPVHPYIIEVDYLLKGIVSYSKNEFQKLTNREFEALQLIISVKNSI